MWAFSRTGYTFAKMNFPHSIEIINGVILIQSKYIFLAHLPYASGKISAD